MSGLVDMEGWAFCSVAMKLTTLEKIHLVKIVSDNAIHSADSIDARKVIDWYAQHSDRLLQIVSMLLQWNDDHQQHSTFQDHLLALHRQVRVLCPGTVTQDHQMRDVLRRALTLGMDQQQILSLCDQPIRIAISNLQSQVRQRALQ